MTSDRFHCFHKSYKFFKYRELIKRFSKKDSPSIYKSIFLLKIISFLKLLLLFVKCIYIHVASRRSIMRMICQMTRTRRYNFWKGIMMVRLAIRVTIKQYGKMRATKQAQEHKLERVESSLRCCLWLCKSSCLNVRSRKHYLDRGNRASCLLSCLLTIASHENYTHL